MNVKEHKLRLVQKLQAKRLMGERGEMLFPEFDWNSLVKPPLYYYINEQAIYQLDRLSQDVKLMNNPTKRYRIMENILRPFGFKPLASGTNRRTFYSVYDESIILKIAFGKVGKQANLVEYNLQNFIKPFCPKIFQVHPSGVVSLIERVETMTERDYKEVWTEDVFDFIFQIFLKGYIMEDIGANFFKNWGVRTGFGPVILDFPYIFEVDWTKLKCVKEDPYTGIICDGVLDYDYEHGMSEIICKKCGTRYSAKYLAKNKDQVLFLKGGENNMFRDSLLTIPAFSIRDQESGQVIDLGGFESRNCRDSSTVRKIEEKINNKAPIISTDARDTDSSFNFPLPKIVDSSERIKENKKVKQQSGKQKQQPIVNTPEGISYYSKDVYGSIIFFLKKMEDRFGDETAIELAGKLGVKFFTKNSRNQKKEEAKQEEEKSTPIASDEEIKKVVFAEEEYENKEMTNEEFQKRWKERNESTINEIASQDLSSLVPPEAEEKKEAPKPNVTLEVPKAEEGDISASKVNQDIPRTGLFPEKPKTRDELMSMEKVKQSSTEMYGFPGHPLTDTMKFNKEVPIIRDKVFEAFNNFTIDSDDILTINATLGDSIKNFIMEDIKRLFPDTYNDLVVDVLAAHDERQKSCHNVIVNCRGTYVFSVNLYQFDDDDTEKYEDIITNKEKLNAFLDDYAKRFDEQTANISYKDDLSFRSAMINYLYCRVEETKAVNIKYGQTDKETMRLITEWVDNNFNLINTSNTINVANEL